MKVIVRPQKVTLVTSRRGDPGPASITEDEVNALIAEAESELNAAIDAESTRATNAEGVLTAAITAETTRATNAEGVLTSAVNTERTRATAAEGVLTAAVNTERTRATAAEGVLTAAIGAETTRASAAEGLLASTASSLQAELDDEVGRATTAEAELAADLVVEAAARAAADTALTDAVDDEADRATAAEGALSTAITSETSRATSAEGMLTAGLNTETTRAMNAEALRIPLTQKGAADGVATLDHSGFVPEAQIPSTIARDAELVAAIASEVTNRDAAITAALAGLVDSAPGTLDTLNEIAAALGDDPNFASTITTTIAGKVSSSLYDANTILIANVDDTPTALAVGASTFVGRKAAGGIAAMTPAEAKTVLAIAESDVAGLTADLAALVPKSLFDANTILIATVDNTPLALTVGASTFVGRKAAGDIAAMTPAEAKTVLAIAEADVTGLTADLAAKAPLASPTFTGTVTAGATNVGAFSANATVLSGNLTFGTDATYDVGASGASRPRDLYVSRNVKIGSSLALNGAAVNSRNAVLSVSPTAAPVGGSAASVIHAFFDTATVNFVTTAQTADAYGAWVRTLAFTSTPAGSVIPDGAGLRVDGPSASGNASFTRGQSILAKTGADGNAAISLVANSATQTGPWWVARDSSNNAVVSLSPVSGDANAANLVITGTTGLKIGTATTQLLAFYNATPVAQPAGSTDVLASLVTLGLRGASSNPPLNLGSGAINASALKSLSGTALTVGSNGSNTVNFQSNNTTRFSLAGGGGLTFTAIDLTFDTTTGSKIGTAANEKIALHGAVPVVQRAGAAQVAVATTAATNLTPFGFATQAQADSIVTLLNEVRATLVEKGIFKGAA